MFEFRTKLGRGGRLSDVMGNGVKRVHPTGMLAEIPHVSWWTKR